MSSPIRARARASQPPVAAGGHVVNASDAAALVRRAEKFIRLHRLLEGGFDRSLDDFRRTIGLTQNQFVLIALIRPRVRLGNNLLGGLLGDFRKVVRHRLAP
jgi:hypothetical protein